MGTVACPHVRSPSVTQIHGGKKAADNVWKAPQKPDLGLDAVANARNTLAALLHALHKVVRIQLLLAGVLKAPARSPGAVGL